MAKFPIDSKKFTIFLLLIIKVACGVKLSKHPVVIVVSFDGFRYDYVNKTSIPNLDRFKYAGVTVPYVMNQFVSATFPNHQSMATGLYVESHGIVGNRLYDPIYDKVLTGKEAETAKEFWNFSPDTVVPLWIANELAGDGRASGVSMWPGGEYLTNSKNTKPTYLRPYKNGVEFEERVDQIIQWITDPTKPANLVFAYFEQPDSAGHKNGPHDTKTVATITRMDNLTGYFLNKLENLGIKDEINLIFTSDHGMTGISPEEVIDLRRVTSKEYFQNGANPVFQIWPRHDHELMEIYTAFKNFAKSDGHFRTYLKTDLKALMPQWHLDCRRTNPILLVPEIGWQFQTGSSPSSDRGLHGYDISYPQMRPYFRARGPAFKVQFTGKVFENVDIYPLVSHILNFTPPPNNGSFENVKDLLVSSKRKSSSSSSGKGVIIIGVIMVSILIIGAIIFLVAQKYKRQHRVVQLTNPVDLEN